MFSCDIDAYTNRLYLLNKLCRANKRLLKTPPAYLFIYKLTAALKFRLK